MVRIYVRAYDSNTKGLCGVYSIYNGDKRLVLHRRAYPFAQKTDAIFLSINASLRAALALGYDEVIVYSDNGYVIHRIQDPWRASAQDQNYLNEMNALIDSFDCVHFVQTSKNEKYPRVARSNHITKFGSE